MPKKNFDVYLQFKSEDFFTDFAENSNFLKKEHNPAEPSWFEQDSGSKVPNWVWLLIGGLVLLFSALGIFICI